MSEKNPLPVGKPILVRLDRIPVKTREKAKFKGEGTKTVVDLPFVVDDRKWPEFFDRTVFVTLTDRIKAPSGEYKSTDSYRFIEQAFKAQFEGMSLGEKSIVLMEAMALYEGNSLSQLGPEQKAPLLKHYVVYMKEPKTDAQGRVWQDPKEIKTVEELEWEVDSRRTPPETVRQSLGLPRPKDGHSQQPQTKASQESPRTPGAPTPPRGMAAPAKETQAPPVGETIKALLVAPGPLRVVAKHFLVVKQAERVGALSEADQRHLLDLLKCEEHIANGGDYGTTAQGFMERCNVQHLWDLNPRDAAQLLKWLDELAADVPF